MIIPTTNILDHFPVSDRFPKPRAKQIEALQKIEKAVRAGRTNIILEAPVGSGKSAIAITVANWFKGGAHILTPQKALQDQYFEDFGSDIVTMKGASNYPCSYANMKFGFNKSNRCGSRAPCKIFKTGSDIKKECLEEGACPYRNAILEAQQHPIVVHNFHSFLYQTMPKIEYFDSRACLIVDEGHLIETILRDFGNVSIKVPERAVQEYPGGLGEDEDTDLSGWYNHLVGYADEYSDRASGVDPSPRTLYLERLDRLELLAGYSNRYLISIEKDSNAHPDSIETTLKIIAKSVAPMYRNKLASMSRGITLLMSGTWYGADNPVSTLGLDPGLTAYISIESEFPAENRPFIFDEEYSVDASFEGMKDVRNIERMADLILHFMERHPDHKGLIHTPSYSFQEELLDKLRDSDLYKRILVHRSDVTPLPELLKEMEESPHPVVLISPTCKQGVDFKDDRARFQVITRLPNLPVTDPYVRNKIKNNRIWYETQTAIAIGQMLGRIVRTPTDWGYTYILDDRFPKLQYFMQRNGPAWQARAYHTELKPLKDED